MRFTLRMRSATTRWLVLATILLGLFLLYSALVANGRFTILTMQQEQWLLQRPLTRFDCVAQEWKALGQVPVSLVLMLGLSIVCWLLGYRRRVMLILLLLLGVGVGSEYLGKQVIQQPITTTINFSMLALACPQISHQPRLTRLEVLAGMWWVAPAPSKRIITIEHAGATTPIVEDDIVFTNGYPSGHTIRWLLLGLVAGWLAWRQVRRWWLRWTLLTIALALAFGGGLAMFYAGGHLFTEMSGGYLLGGCLACCAIACLSANEKKSRRYQLNLPIAQNNGTLHDAMIHNTYINNKLSQTS